MSVLGQQTLAGVPPLEVHDVSVRFGQLQALSNVSVDVPAATAVGLIGPNGAGKSTLLAAAGGQQRATGTVRLDGQDITHLDPAARARIGLHRTFQSLELFDDLSVRDNVLLAAGARRTERRGGHSPHARRQRRSEAAEEASALLADLNLEGYLDTPAHELPAPVRRWVSYARAIVGSPKCVLLDEPAAGLAEREREALAAQIKSDIDRHGFGVVVVEHDMGFVSRLCEHIYVLNAGKIIASGTFAEVVALQHVREAYLGEGASEH